MQVYFYFISPQLNSFPHSKLEPYLTDADQYDIINVTTDTVLPAPSLSPNIKRKDITIVSACGQGLVLNSMGCPSKFCIACVS